MADCKDEELQGKQTDRTTVEALSSTLLTIEEMKALFKLYIKEKTLCKMRRISLDYIKLYNKDELEDKNAKPRVFKKR